MGDPEQHEKARPDDRADDRPVDGHAGSEDTLDRFLAAPGEWTLRTLAPKADTHDLTVVAEQGVVAEVAVAI